MKNTCLAVQAVVGVANRPCTAIASVASIFARLGTWTDLKMTWCGVMYGPIRVEGSA